MSGIFAKSEQLFKPKCCVKKFESSDDLYNNVGPSNTIFSTNVIGTVELVAAIRFTGQDLVTVFNNAGGYVLITGTGDGINKLVPYAGAVLVGADTDLLFTHPVVHNAAATGAAFGTIHICLWQNLVHNFNTEKHLIVHGEITRTGGLALPNGGESVEINGGLLEIVDTNEIAWNPWPFIPPVAANQLDGTETATATIRRITDL